MVYPYDWLAHSKYNMRMWMRMRREMPLYQSIYCTCAAKLRISSVRLFSRSTPREHRPTSNIRHRHPPTVIKLPDQDLTAHLATQPLPPLGGQLVRKGQAARPLDRLDGHLEITQALLVGDLRVGQHEGAERHLPDRTVPRLLAVDDLVEVGGHGDVGGRADDLVADAPLAIDGVAFGQVEGARDDADRRVFLGEVAAELFQVRPVVAVEPLADLRAHVGQDKGAVHGFLAPLGVGGGDLVAAVVAAAGVVGEFGAEDGREGRVFVEGGEAPRAVVEEERGRCDVFGDEVGGAQGAVVGA